MSRIKSFLLVVADTVFELPEEKGDNMVFVSLTNPELYASYINEKSENTSSAFLASETHGESIARVISKAYQMRVQYVKVLNNNQQIVYLNRKSPLVYLLNGSWGVSINDLRALIKSRVSKKKGLSIEKEHDLFFDPNYTDVGFVHDLSFLLGKQLENLPQMNVHDLSVYIARWGGAPGKEKFTVPYNL